MNDGAPVGGSGGQYVVGRFDGREFMAEDADRGPRWIDKGKDFYASQAWNNAPDDARPVWIAWMNNWQYANEIPTSRWRGDREETEIGVVRRGQMVYVDRARSATVGFSSHFPGRNLARLTATDASCVRLHIFVDATSVEVFADDGLVVFTDQIFPSPTSRGVSLFATGGAARLRSLEAWELRP